MKYNNDKFNNIVIILCIRKVILIEIQIIILN